MITVEIKRFVFVYVGESLMDSGKNNLKLIMDEGHDEER
jgi:hypothetical protein